jgi:Putative peptidoglycan binding domain
MEYRKLTQAEQMIAESVFKTSVAYNSVFIADYFLPGNNVPVTVQHPITKALPIIGTPIITGFYFVIYWGLDVYRQGADTLFDGNGDCFSNTLIHELTHVWQGQHGMPFGYMVESMLAQGKAIAQHWDRGEAYNYDKTNYKNWRDYNVEQQGNIVGDWFHPNISIVEGKLSVTDLRYPYIEKVVRAGNPSADYAPPVQTNVIFVGDPIVFEAQTILVKWGYKIVADGRYGSITRNAIFDFQKNNGLKSDGNLGPKTIAKLRQIR